MAYFALLDENNIVISVEQISDCYAGNEDQLRADTGLNYREAGDKRRHTGHGQTYDVERDEFIAEQPYPSWTLNDSAEWEAPAPMPLDEGALYVWDEEKQSWENALTQAAPSTSTDAKPVIDTTGAEDLKKLGFRGMLDFARRNNIQVSDILLKPNMKQALAEYLAAAMNMKGA